MMIDTFAEYLRQRLGIRMAFIGQRGNPARKFIAARIEKNFGFRAFREANFGQLRSTAVDLFAEGFRQRFRFGVAFTAKYRNLAKQLVATCIEKGFGFSAFRAAAFG